MQSYFFVIIGIATFLFAVTITEFYSDLIDYANILKFKDKSSQKDEFNILITEFGWNSPDESIRNRTVRTKYSTLFTERIMRHPHYLNSSIHANITESSQNIVFLDLDTCYESNWPNYARGFMNFDVFGRPQSYAFCEYLIEVIHSAALLHPKSRLVLLDCRGNPFQNGHPHGGYFCFEGLGSNDPDYKKEEAAIIWKKLMIGFVSLDSTNFIPNTDIPFGLPPMAIRPLSLNDTQVAYLYNCSAATERQWFFFYRGRQANKVRQRLKFLHDPENHIYLQSSGEHLGKGTINASTSDIINDDYMDMLTNTIFAAVPRGDNLFSYRFAEVLSAGAIPVIYADNWVLPFTNAVVNWTDIAVMIPQIKVNETINILRNISMDQICKMQQNAYEVFHKYIKTHDELLDGILETVYHKTKDINITIQ